MNRVLPLLMVCMLLLLNVPARARSQETRKPRTPACGTWDFVYSPNPKDGPAFLGVAAVPGTNELWAVGNYVYADSLTMIEHWDGTSWQVVPSPNVGTHDNLLRAVSVVPNSQAVWAVGFEYEYTGGPFTLIERWDGTTWNVVPSANGYSRENYLFGVSSSGR